MIEHVERLLEEIRECSSAVEGKPAQEDHTGGEDVNS